MTASLELDGMTVPVEISDRTRQATLTIERDGGLLLRTAPDVDEHELEEFLVGKRTWIYRKLAEKETLQHEPVVKELVSGEGFLYLGRSHQLRLVDDGAGDVRLQRGRLLFPQSLLVQGAAPIIDWYRRCGLNWLKPHLRQWSQRLRVEPGRLEVADLGHKWGSATASGRIRIHWAAMQLRPPLVDYVLAHELSHLREPHHGPAFWQVLRQIMPDYDERKAELARIGGQLWLGAF